MGKTEQITSYLRNEILHGRIKPGDKVFSRFEIMKRFDCSRATADKAVSDLVQGGVLETSKGGGTFVKAPGKRPVLKSAAVVGPEPGHPSMAQEIFQGLMQGLGSEQPIRFFTYDELRQSRAWKSCKSHQGVIFIMPDVQHSLYIMEARQDRVPHLVVFRDPPESPFVSIDNPGGVGALVRALSARGCRRIAFIARRESRHHFPEQRYSGYLEALLKLNLPFDRSLVGLASRGTEEAVAAAVMERRPEAVIVVNYSMGPVIQAGKAAGLEPGRAYHLASFDPVAEGTYSFPVMSLGRITEQAGREAAAVLKDLLKDPSRLIQKYITPDVNS